jgi:hypothetical protein
MSLKNDKSIQKNHYQFENWMCGLVHMPITKQRSIIEQPSNT